MQVSITEAKDKLSELIRAVEQGEQVTITRRGVPVVDLVPAKVAESIKLKLGTGKRKFGTLVDKVKIHDPDWWHPMT